VSSITICRDLHYEFKSLPAGTDLHQTLAEAPIRAIGKCVMIKAGMEWKLGAYRRKSAEFLPSG
jgi:hypothetical protein